jgi:hypothetical protein
MLQVMDEVALATLPAVSRISSGWRPKLWLLSVSVNPQDLFCLQFGLSACAASSILTASPDAVLSFATIALALKVPRMEDVKGQQLAVLIWAAVLFGTYSFLLSVFKAKNGGYPFYLPPF